MRLIWSGVLAIAAVLAVQLGDGISSSSSNAEAAESTPMTYAGATTQSSLVVTAEGGETVPQEEAYQAFLERHAAVASDGDGDPDEEISDEAFNGVIQRVCMSCHNDALETGNLTLEGFDVAAAAEDLDRTEAMINKLRLEMMPPPGIPRPGGDTLLALARTLEEKVDEAASAEPDPGSRVFQRLNRAEYERAIEDLLGLQVDAGDWLPLDSYLGNFDNMADAQALSPTLLESYLTAAGTISRMAVGDPDAPATHSTYQHPPGVSQHQWERIEGAPFGTRGGMVVNHHFPADGEYVFEVQVRAGSRATFEDVDVSINGEQVALLPFEPDMRTGNRGGGYPLRTEPIQVEAGQHRVAVAFRRQFEGPYEDLLRPHEWSLAGEGESSSYGVTNLPHVWNITIAGPENPSGVSETESRQRIFTCYPSEPSEERECAESIISRMATEAYRRPATEEDMQGLMSFYEAGAEEDGFENGVRLAVQAILASPHFIFRMEEQPLDVQPGDRYALNDLDLASRLAFFLWGAPPDEELLEVAKEGRLSDLEVLEEQALRMLAHPKAEALSTRFAAQWLRLQDMENVRPDPFWYPDFSENLREDMRRETELLFDHLVREDRSVLELFTADYTFANERLARHYGIPDVVGDEFRRVSYPEEANRRGILGHGSVLLLTSMGNRTSPVLRGKWVMEVLMGSPPPPPPPNVPELEETEGVEDGRVLTTRERMELHRANPACASCHQVIDPIGVAMDNFDVLGRWRMRENGIPVDTQGEFYDGSRVTGPGELVDVLLKRPIPLVRNFTEYLLSYALARPVENRDQPTVRQIVRDAEEDDYSISSLVLGVVKSEPFRMKRAERLAEDDADS